METLDKFDLAILNELQTDGRLTNTDLAQRVGLSAAPGPCWRVRHKIGLGVMAFVRLDAERNTGDGTRQLEEAIRKLPEVVSCHYISGHGTFELQVVAQDLDSFSRFALRSLINLPNVKDLHTSFSLGEVKASSSLPLTHLAQDARSAPAPASHKPAPTRRLR